MYAPSMQMYEAIVDGSWPYLDAPRRQRLFSSGQQLQGTHMSPTLAAKVLPGLRTSRNWTRLARRLLPRYLPVLDANGGLLLLRALRRQLEPPVPPNGTPSWPLGLSAASLSRFALHIRPLLSTRTADTRAPPCPRKH